MLLDIERESAEDPEWIDHEERGSCHGCCEAPPRVLAAMKASGELDQEDPWGAMGARLDAAAGSSNRAGSGVLPPPPAFDDEEDGHSRSPSPDMLPVLTKGKGKGRASVPEENYASRYGAAPAEEPAARSDGEESASSSGRPQPKSSQPPKYEFRDSDDEEEEVSEEEEEEEHARPARGRKMRRTDSSISRGSSSSKEEEDGHVPRWGGAPPRRDSDDAPDYDDEEEDDEEVIEVSPAERAKYGIPPKLPMTETKLKVWKQSKANERA